MEILAAVRQSGVTARSHVVRVQGCGGPAVSVRSQVVVVAAGRRTVVERSQVVVRPLHDVVDVGLVVVGGRRQAEQCRAALRRRHHSAQRPCLAGTVSYECTDTSNQTSTRPKYASGGAVLGGLQNPYAEVLKFLTGARSGTSIYVCCFFKHGLNRCRMSVRKAMLYW